MKKQEEITQESRDNKFASFRVAGKLYGFPVISVQEIIKPMKVTPIPLSPNYLKGLFNLRGQITSAICLRALLQLEDGQSEESMQVICLHEKTLFSFVVDEVGDVVWYDASTFVSPPKNASKFIQRFSKGMATLDKELLCVLNIQEIVNYLDQSA